MLVALSGALGETLLEYRFDEPDSDRLTYVDSSGNGRELRLYDEMEQMDDNPFAEQLPKLNGKDKSIHNVRPKLTNDGADVIGAEAIRLDTNGEFTIEGWVRWEGGAGGLCRIHGPQLMLWLAWDSAGKVYITCGKGRVVDANAKLTANEWTHLAYVSKKDRFLVYVNGEEVAAGPLEAEEPGYLAERLTKVVLFEADGALIGGVDDFRLSDVALTPDQLGFHRPFTSE